MAPASSAKHAVNTRSKPSKPNNIFSKDFKKGFALKIQKKGIKNMYFICTTRYGFITRRFSKTANLQMLRRHYGKIVLTNAI